MRARSQRHLASARGSSLLAWLPQPGRGARSPPAHHRLPAPVSLLGSLGRPCRPVLGFWGDVGSALLCPGPQSWIGSLCGARRGWGSSGSAWGSIPAQAAGAWPFLSVFPLLPTFRPSPCAWPAFPGVSSSPSCVCWHSQRRCWPATVAVLSLWSPSWARAHYGAGTWHELSPSRRWGPAGGFPCRVAVAGRCRAAWHAAGGGPQLPAAGGPVLGTAPTGPRPQPCHHPAVLLASPWGGWWPWGHTGCSSRAAPPR